MGGWTLVDVPSLYAFDYLFNSTISLEIFLVHLFLLLLVHYMPDNKITTAAYYTSLFMYTQCAQVSGIVDF